MTTKSDIFFLADFLQINIDLINSSLIHKF